MTEETEQTEETEETKPEQEEETEEEKKEEETQEEQPEEKQEEKQEARREKAGSLDNVVYIGKKSVMNYVMAVMTQFNQGNSDVSVKARGRSISRAVDVAEILRNKFLGEVELKNIDIQTEEMENENGTKSKVSSIEIILTK